VTRTTEEQAELPFSATPVTDAEYAELREAVSYARTLGARLIDGVSVELLDELDALKRAHKTLTAVTDACIKAGYSGTTTLVEFIETRLN
jgi:hypothetical protein